MAYSEDMVTWNQKSTRDIQEIKTKELKYNSTESHQHVREENKRIRKEQRRTTKTIRRQLIKCQ